MGAMPASIGAMLTARGFLDALFPPRGTEALLRHVREEAFLACLEPLALRLDGASATTLASYAHPPVHAAVIEAKFHGSRHAARLLGSLLRSYLEEELADKARYETKPVVLVPVPLSLRRRRARGYNQAERIGAAALKDMLFPVALAPRLLKRTRDTLPQTALDGAARRKNMRGAFSAARPVPEAPLYIVFDDVMTTGATLRAAVTALRAGGAKDVCAIAVAGSFGKAKEMQ